jgi:hypothetical protein
MGVCLDSLNTHASLNANSTMATSASSFVRNGVASENILFMCATEFSITDVGPQAI